MKNKIVCLFSIDNNYDQPGFNLEAWFDKKPSIEELFNYFTIDLKDGKAVTLIVDLWNNKKVTINDTSYRFETVEPGFGQVW